MAISKFTPQSAKKDTGRTIGDNEVAKLANLNKLVNEVNAEFANLSPGGGNPPLDVVSVGTLGTTPLLVSYSVSALLNPAAGTQSAPVITYPTINLNGGMGFSGTLSSITFPTLTAAIISIYNVSTLTSVSLPALTTVFPGQMGGGLTINYCSSLTVINLPEILTIPAGVSINFSSNALTQSTVDNILVRLVATGVTNGSIDLSGGTSSAPSATGLAAKATLQGRSWNVYTN